MNASLSNVLFIPQQNNEQAILSLSLSMPEFLFSEFMEKMLSFNLEKGLELIYLGATPNLQKGFDDWVISPEGGKNYPLTEQERIIQPLIASIWEKTKIYINQLLQVSGNLEVLNKEQKLQQRAEEALKDFTRQGKVGYIFTSGQVVVMLENLKKH